MSHGLKWVAWVLLPLLGGSAVYLFFRSNKPNIFHVEFLNSSTLEYPQHLLTVALLSSLPSGLWTFSLTTALLLIWQRDALLDQITIGSVGLTAAVLFEVLQCYELIAGTFDWRDIYFSTAAALLAVFIYHKTSP